MTLSEIFFLLVPIIWFSCERILVKKSPLPLWRWIVLFVGCMFLSFFLSLQLSVMMGGKIIWPEVLYYGWFLFALFVILQWYIKKPRPMGAVSGVFMIGYGVMRFMVEFFREPDLTQGFVLLGWVTKGQVLSIPMVLVGFLILLWANKHKIVAKQAR